MSVSTFAIHPPVQDSAVARRAPAASRRSPVLTGQLEESCIVRTRDDFAIPLASETGTLK